ncbi:MAG: hypothetical protein ACR2RV_17030, partial [Verrucomicrobiales bacterium]
GNDLGGAPIEPTVSWQSYDIGGSPQTQLTLSFPVSLGADGAKIAIDASTDLSTWSDAVGYSELVSQTNLGDGRALVTVRFTSPIGDGATQFVRLRVDAL